MALSKYRKVDRDEWTEKYAFILPAMKSTRPVSTESVAIVKSGIIKRQYETRHRHLDKT